MPDIFFLSISFFQTGRIPAKTVFFFPFPFSTEVWYSTFTTRAGSGCFHQWVTVKKVQGNTELLALLNEKVKSKLRDKKENNSLNIKLTFPQGQNYVQASFYLFQLQHENQSLLHIWEYGRKDKRWTIRNRRRSQRNRIEGTRMWPCRSCSRNKLTEQSQNTSRKNMRDFFLGSVIKIKYLGKLLHLCGLQLPNPGEMEK